MFDYKKLLKFLLEGLAVSVSAFFILGKKKCDIYSIIIIGLTAAAVFALLEKHSTDIVNGVRQGSGFGIGWNMVGGNAPDSSSDSPPDSSPPDSSPPDSSPPDSSPSDDESVDTMSSLSSTSSTDSSSTESSNESTTNEPEKINARESLKQGLDAISETVKSSTDKLKTLF